jgi:hypothetical protein
VNGTHAIYTNLAAKGLGNFETSNSPYYWSSYDDECDEDAPRHEEWSSRIACFHYLGKGEAGSSWVAPKDTAKIVRPDRAF